ncbi:hypothetical protein QQF64_014732 [Cirrhinus molitorella]|uniref:Uncharacterized protein n=1 Tax=Cirrhinus molitorella TaxID=172907 RepID=A0ABR3NTF0_9TELE
MSDKGAQRLCETRQTEQRRKRRVRINPRRAALLSLYELHLLMRAKRETERGRNRRREWERGIVALHNGPANIPVSPSLAPWACACVGAADCKNEGWEKKGIGKGRGQGYNGWEGLKIPPYVTHT